MEMKSKYQLKEKIKISDGISMISLLVAILSLIFSLSPKNARIDYEILPEFTWGEDNDFKTVVRILIKNNGNRKVTIESLGSTDMAGIFGITDKGDRLNMEKSTFLYKINKELYGKYFIPSKIDSLNHFSLSDGLIINKVVEPGENIQLNILITRTIRINKQIESISVNALLKGSDNSRTPIYFEFDANVGRRIR